MAEANLPMFYSRPRPLDSRIDASRSLLGAPDYKFAAHTNSVPLLASEFVDAGRQYPIVFAANDAAMPLMLLGLRDNENLFVDAQGKWASEHYVPAYVRRYPFIFMESGDKQQLTLCIDEAAGRLVESTENPVFKDGNPTDVLQHALDFCRQFQVDYVATQEFARAVHAAGLLEENRANVTLRGGERLSLSGFRVIDEQRFNALPDDVFLQWRARGWLILAYCHLLSVRSWSALVNRAAPAG